MNSKHSMVIIFLVLFSIVSNVACTKENNDPANDSPEVNNSQDVAANESNAASETAEAAPVAAANVFALNSVKPAVAGKAIDFTWIKDGKEMSFSEYTKDKVVLINFWGTWCPPCRAELPDLVSISNELPADKFVMIGIALERNPNNAVQNVQQFCNANNIEYLNFIDATQELAMAYGPIQYVPTTFVIDSDGNKQDTMISKKSKEEFMNVITKYLN